MLIWETGSCSTLVLVVTSLFLTVVVRPLRRSFNALTLINPVHMILLALAPGGMTHMIAGAVLPRLAVVVVAGGTVGLSTPCPLLNSSRLAVAQ